MCQQHTTSEDLEVIRSIQEGNRDGFNQLTDRYGRDLAAFVWCMTAGALSREDVGDIIQDTWAEAYQRIINPGEKRQYDPARGSFKTFLVNIAKYRILSRFGRLKSEYRQRWQTDPEDAEDIIGNLPDQDEYIPEKKVIEKEEKKLRLSAYLQVIRLVFLCGGYPHQQLAFVFSKFLHGKQSARSLEGKAEVIYSGEMSALPLSTVAVTARARIKESVQAAVVQETLSYMEPLDLRLVLRLDRLMANDWQSRNHYKNILEKIARDTCFKDYYGVSGQSASNTVSNWIYKLEQNIKKQLGLQGEAEAAEDGFPADPPAQGDSGNGCRRCRFREIPPCGEKN